MKIERLRIHGFGRWVNRTFEFPPGLSLWIGPNEAGKSTIVQALLSGLYGLARRRAPLREIQDRYRPWSEGAPFGLEIELSDGGVLYRLTRDFSAENSQAFRQDGDRYLPVADPERLAAELIGLNGAALFRSTLLITQGEVAAVQEGRPGEAIAAKVASGDDSASTAAALRWLERELGELVKEGRSEATFSAVQRARLQAEYWQKKFDALTEAAAQEQEWAKKLQEIRGEISRKEKYRETYGPLVQRFAEYQNAKSELEKSLQALKEAIGRKARAEKELAAWHEARGRWEAMAERETLAPERRPEVEEAWTAFNLDQERLKGLQSRKEQLVRDLEKLRGETLPVRAEDGKNPNREDWSRYVSLKEKLADVRRSLETLLSSQEFLCRRLRTGLFGWLGLVAGVGLGIAGGRMLQSSSVLRWLLPAGILLLSWSIFVLTKARRTAAENRRIGREIDSLNDEAVRIQSQMAEILAGANPDAYLESVLRKEREAEEAAEKKARLTALQSEVDQLEQERGQLAARLAEQEIRLREYWQKAGAEDQETYRLLCLEYDRKAQEERAARERAQTLLQDKTLEEWEENIVALTAACRMQEAKAEELRLDVDALEVARYKQELAAVESDLARLAQEEAVLKDRLETLHRVQGTEDRFRAAAELQRWREEERNVLARAEGIRMAAAMLAEAGKEVNSRLTPRLAARTAELLARVSNGRYRAVRVVEDGAQKEDFQVEVAVSPSERWIAPHSLSGGARDQLYIALRIALGEYLTDRTDFPLILDDPFVHFDPGRLAATVELLKELGKEHQIIWFSKDPRLAWDFPGLVVKEIESP